MSSSSVGTLLLSMWFIGCSQPPAISTSSPTAADSVLAPSIPSSQSSATQSSTAPSSASAPAATSSAPSPSIAPLLGGSLDPKAPLSIPPHWVVESEALDRLLRDGAPDLLTEGWTASGKTCEHQFQARRRTSKPALHVKAFVDFAAEVGVNPSTDERGAVRLYADTPTQGPPFFALAEGLDIIGGSNVFLHVKHPNVDVQACLRKYAAALPLGDLGPLLELPGVSLDVVNVAREEGKKPSTMIRALVARHADGAVIDWLLHHEFAPRTGSGAKSFTRTNAEINLADGSWTLYVDRGR